MIVLLQNIYINLVESEVPLLRSCQNYSKKAVAIALITVSLCKLDTECNG